MGRTLTNNTGFSATIESTLGVLPGSPIWFTLEPNDVSELGAKYTTLARNPISKNRQRRKGTVVDRDSGFVVEHDLTLSAADLFIEAFVMATGTNADTRFRNLPAVSGGYTIPAATAAQAAKFQFNASGPFSLVFGRGYVNAANNGVRALTSDLAGGGTTIPVTGSTAETPPTNATLELMGIRATAGDLAITVSGTQATITSGNHAISGAAQINFTTLGLTAGQVIHWGGMTNTNRGFGAGPVVSYGFMRVKSIAAAALVCDKIDTTVITSDGTVNGAGGANVAIDLLFGDFIRNVAVDNAAFLSRSFQFEAAWKDLQNPGPGDEYSYIIGNMCNEMEINLAVADKATVNFSFVGKTTDNPTTVRKTGAATPVDPIKTGAFNMAADFVRLRVTKVDETGLSTDVKEGTLKIGNGVTGEKVLATLGPKYLNTGNFEVDFEGKVLFTEGDVIDAIAANTEVTMDFILRNADGAIAVDIPAMTLGDGSPELPVNESVNLNLTGSAHQSSVLGTSIGISLFPTVPTS
jgi:hypothetical protein